MILECKRRASHTDLFTFGTHAVWALKILFEERAGDLTLRRSDREVQYVFYDLRNVETQTLGPPVVELGWCDILQTAWASFTFHDPSESALSQPRLATSRQKVVEARFCSTWRQGQNDGMDARD